MLSRMVVQSCVGILVFGLLLFLPAGTLRWPQAWVFLILCNGCGLVTGIWLQRCDPGLLAERMRSPLGADQRPRDRAIISTMLLAFIAWLVAIGLDHRFGWSRPPGWTQALGAILILAAFPGFASVFQANSFAAVTVRVQEERGQTVISSGPYAVVRHPMYAYALLLLVGTPLLLGSLWGLAGLLLMVPLLAARTLGEEALLREKLPGYRDYTSRVRSRLLPGIW